MNDKTYIKMRKTVLLILTVTFFGCSKYNYNVERVNISSEINESEGFYYALPLNQIKVDIIVKKTDRIKGPYAPFASKYLGLENVIKESSTSYQISDVVISSKTYPDPLNYFYVELYQKKGIKGKNKNIYVELTESGSIKSVNTKHNEQEKNIAGIDLKESTFNYFSKLHKLSAYDNLYMQVDTVIEKVNLDTITIEKKILRKTLVEKSAEQKAKEAADFIMELKEAKVQLLRGYAEINYSRATIDYMISNLDSMETDYISMFTGITNSKLIKYSFTFIPKDGDLSIPLCRFSEEEGVLDTNRNRGEYIMLNFEPTGNTGIVSTRIQQKNNLPKDFKGFYYRIPEMVKVSVSREKNVITKENFLIPQFGSVTYLPPVYNEIEFYPNSGAIKSLKFND